MMSEKIDLKKTMKNFYQPSTKAPVIVELPPMQFLMIDGRGNPNNNVSFQEATGALYALSYAIKFAVKKTQGVDYGVMPLEGLWWMADDAELDLVKKEKWAWTLMICQPEMVTAALVEEMRENVRRKKNPPRLESIRLETYAEGTAVQIMYVGPYDAELPSVDAIHAYARQQGYELHKKHHEIYLNDPQKTAPERMKTVLRQPVFKK
jgi:hypothetical protein